MNAIVRATSTAAMYRWLLRERRYEYVSREVVGITGFRAEELELSGREFWRERIHPEDRARVEAEVDAVREGGRATVFYRFLRKDRTYCTLMEHLYAGADGERRAFLDGVLRDMTGQVSVGSLGTREVIGIPVAASGKRKLTAGAGMVALLVLALGTGYLAGLRQAAWSRPSVAWLTSTPSNAQVASRGSKPAKATHSRGKRATDLTEARATGPQPRHQIERNRTTAAPSVQPDLGPSRTVAGAAPSSARLPNPATAALPRQPDRRPAPPSVAETASPSPIEPAEEKTTPSLWSWVAHLPAQPIAPDPPSFR